MTYVIMDIDGVLNPFYARYNPELNFTWLGKDNRGFFLKPDMHTPWLQRIAEHATLIWGSAWANDSNLVLELLGIEGSWDWVPLEEADEVEPEVTWKLKSVQEWAANVPAGEKIVWLDDEINRDAFDWSNQRGNTLLICPDRYTGLTDDDFRKVFDFIR